MVLIIDFNKIIIPKTNNNLIIEGAGGLMVPLNNSHLIIDLIKKLDAELVEMKSCKSRGLCCGAGGAQMFKEAEKGDKEINVERTEDALEVKPNIIATGCPFCNTMMTDGVKNKEREDDVVVMDVAELIAQAADL